MSIVSAEASIVQPQLLSNVISSGSPTISCERMVGAAQA
jgi:hypothetical protein